MKEEGKKEKRIRFQLNLTEEEHDKIKSMQKKDNCATGAQLMRNAIRLYDWYLAQKEKGNTIMMKQEGGGIVIMKSMKQEGGDIVIMEFMF